jgi:small-conductance mechanosensitive channel
MDLTDVFDFLHAAARSVGAEVSSPWFYFQLGLILAGAGMAFAASTAIRSSLNTSAIAMGWPAPLRLLIRVILASISTAVFAILMMLARLAMLHSTWPSRSYWLAVAAKLALAWLVIRLFTSMISNAFLVRLVALSAWLVAALSMIGQLDPTIDALDSVSVVLGGLRLTPLLLIKLGVLLAVALWLTNIISNFLEGRIAQSSDLTPSIQVLLIKMVRVILMIVAVAVAMSAVGIDLSALAIFSGAAGVGIGFGLQKIIANFISGIILLADKSVKPGDLVTIGDSSGRISAMNTRYISVAAGDGREVLIPNEDLVTQKVINWTYNDSTVLVKIPFATSYEADPRQVCELAAELAVALPRAIKAKPPNCILVEFTDAGMRFLLTFWLPDPDGIDNVKSEVMQSLWDQFRRQGIGMPYPIREIRVSDGALPIELSSSRWKSRPIQDALHDHHGDRPVRSDNDPA